MLITEPSQIVPNRFVYTCLCSNAENTMSKVTKMWLYVWFAIDKPFDITLPNGIAQYSVDALNMCNDATIPDGSCGLGWKKNTVDLGLCGIGDTPPNLKSLSFESFDDAHFYYQKRAMNIADGDELYGRYVVAHASLNCKNLKFVNS